MYSLYKHKQLNEAIVYRSFVTLPSQQRRMIRLKQKLLYNHRLAIKWITLTYDDDHLNSDYKRDIANFIKRLKYHLTKNLEKLTKFHNDSLFGGSKKLQYLWRFETNSKGQRQYNPHFHLVMNIKPFIMNNKMREIWENGFVHISQIKSLGDLKHYIAKYMIKDKEQNALVSEFASCDKCANSHCGSRGSLTHEWDSIKKKWILPESTFTCQNFVSRVNSWFASRGYKKPKSEWKYIDTLSYDDALQRAHEIRSRDSETEIFKYAGFYFKNIRSFVSENTLGV